VLGSAVVDPPLVPQYANLTTTSIFWPNETAADGTVFACTYLPTMVLANGTRLIVHGRCYTQRQAAMSRVCGGFHVSAAASFSLAAARSTPLGPINLCQKHSDTGGLHWSRIRSVGTGLTTGQVLWDRVGEVLIAQNSEVDTSGMFTLRTVERRSYDLGQSWVQARDVSHLLPGNVTQVVAALGGALQLSSNNRYHPGRMIWNGVGTHGNITNRALVWYSDDGGKTFQFSRDANTGSIFLPEGIGEESALAETPDGGIFLSSRNVLYHGKSRCNCRASVRFARGGDTFGGVFPSPELVEPECEATMLGPVDDSAGAMFHANPGHGTDTENKSPPDGRASGTVRRSVDGGRT
jgi:hypothetical protein